jgi:protein SCO1/2
MRNSLGCLALIASSAFGQSQFRPLPAPNALTKPAMLKNVGIDQKLNAQVPLDLTFRDEAGRTVPLGSFFQKKPVILALVYYECPMLCNMTLNGLVRSLHSITLSAGDDFELVAVSINPRESPQLAMAKKETYLEKYQRHNATNGWHFLTGKEENIQALADAVGFRYAYDPIIKQYAHAAGIMIATPDGKLSRYFYGIEFPSRDLRLGLVEASNNKIGSPVDQVLLYCYHYDPVTGKYGLAIQRLLQVMGSATALALGTFLFVNFRRERRPADLGSGRAV